MKTWRSDGWKNPHGMYTSDGAYDDYEDGADAMYEPAHEKGKAEGKKELLEELRKNNKVNVAIMGEPLPLNAEGMLVFIPDEEEVE